MGLEITQEQVGETTILALTGDLDTNTSGQLEAKVKEIAEGDNPSIILDMDGVKFVSSFGLRVIVITSKIMRAHGDRIAMCNVQKEVLAILKMAGFISFLKVADSREDALKELGA